ncbi:helix-turn-helix transcriptional regulator [Marinilactibacillus psychrotolerans]|uniref:Helix-turn-helix transcriptional regulator n=1 Tax=Marinilactibacillus psychrotolerans TaxID=191770 RepID=A0A5R9C2W3_9LACT|nr:helix-turn-helix transcriptional regulator [Marinilactibacillus psychrotolerans]TLQ07083.1 helix-turn-helix transcriptional regulator [Marinilactibacillus psychrotolerans]
MKTLKQLRLSVGISQSELAAMFGVSSKTIQNMEKDSSNIKDSLLSKYLKAFEIGYDEIFLGKEYEIFEFEKRKKEKIVFNLKNKQPN